MSAPPSSTGGTQVTTSELLADRATTFVGAPGTDRGVIVEVTDEGLDVPMAFTATTVNV